MGSIVVLFATVPSVFKLELIESTFLLDLRKGKLKYLKSREGLVFLSHQLITNTNTHKHTQGRATNGVVFWGEPLPLDRFVCCVYQKSPNPPQKKNKSHTHITPLADSLGTTALHLHLPFYPHRWKGEGKKKRTRDQLTKVGQWRMVRTD